MSSGFGSLLDVQVLGYYRALHQNSSKTFLAYVLQVSTSSSRFLVYRRYSQITSFIYKLSIHSTVHLPPKYSLQVYPLTKDQLEQRFLGLDACLRDVFDQLVLQREQGLHHDDSSPAGQDMQIFYDFLMTHKNRPLRPAGQLPDWAKPSSLSRRGSDASSMASYHRHSSVISSPASSSDNGYGLEQSTHAPSTSSAWQDAEDVDVDTSVEEANPSQDLSDVFRNELLQAESNLNALSNCIKAYRKATSAWWLAADAVADEYRRVAQMPLLQSSDDINSHAKALAQTHNRLVDDLQPRFDKQCDQAVSSCIDSLVHEVLPEVKNTHWTRLTKDGGSSHPHQVNTFQVEMDRRMLEDKMKTQIQESMQALFELQNTYLEEMKNRLNPWIRPDGQKVDVEEKVDVTEDVTDVTEDENVHQSEQSVDSPSNDMETNNLYVWGRPPNVEAGMPLILRPKSVSLAQRQSIVQVACGGEHALYLTDTGDVYSSGDTSTSFLSPHLLEDLALEKALHQTKIVQVACGGKHSMALNDVGELYSWGSGEDGRLGHGDLRDRSVPRKVMALLKERVVHVACGGAHTAVLTDQHAIFTFGRGRNGRLGMGDTKGRDTPQEVTCFASRGQIVHVVCGWNFTCALSDQGQVFSWGKQTEGQCGLGYSDKDQLVPKKVERLRHVMVVDMACGYTHTLALGSNNQIYAWGLGEYGQLGRGAVYQPVPEVVDMSTSLDANDSIRRVYAGAFHSVVTTDANVVYAWGLNLYGACGLGHTTNKDSPTRVDTFDHSKDLYLACGHKYTVALEASQPRIPPHIAYFQASPSSLTPLSSNKQRRHSFSDVMDSVADSPQLSSSGSPEYSAAVRHTNHVREEELRRAKKLWTTRVLKDWNESKDTPLAQSLWRRGIPPSIRAKVWPLAIGNKLKITPDMYQIYRRRARSTKTRARSGDQGIGREHTLSMIDTDLPRTFPSLQLFDATGPYYDFLLEVLETYACYRPDLGYIQGMSYLAALLCLHMPQDRFLAFQCLANLMVHEHLFSFYLLDNELSGVYYRIFDDFLQARLPQLQQHLKSINVTPSMYLMNWLQTLFLQVLPLEAAARVVDNFLLDGTVFLFRAAMAIHELLLDDLIHAPLEEAMPLIQKSRMHQDVWQERITEDALFRTIANVTVPHKIYASLDDAVNDAFFYQKRKAKKQRRSSTGDVSSLRSSGGQSAGIGRVKRERRQMYAISDTLNGVLGGV